MSLTFTCKLYLISKESIHFLSVFKVYRGKVQHES